MAQKPGFFKKPGFLCLLSPGKLCGGDDFWAGGVNLGVDSKSRLANCSSGAGY
jgi:hypothetical protein